MHGMSRVALQLLDSPLTSLSSACGHFVSHGERRLWVLIGMSTPAGSQPVLSIPLPPLPCLQSSSRPLIRCTLYRTCIILSPSSSPSPRISELNSSGVPDVEQGTGKRSIGQGARRSGSQILSTQVSYGIAVQETDVMCGFARQIR